LIVLAIQLGAKLVGLGEDSKQSFYSFVELVKEVKDDPHGTIKSMSLRMDKETVILGFPKNNEPIKIGVNIPQDTSSVQTPITLSIKKPISEENCEENKACICLCGEIELKKDTVICSKNHLICKNIEGIDFHEYLPSKEISFTYYSKTNGFIISNSKIFNDLINKQVRPVYVEKYESKENNITYVCEQPKNGSCIEQKDKKQLDAISGLNKLKEFIEPCREYKIEEGDYCGCGLFAFEYEIPEGYGVKFSEEDGALLLTLRKDKKNTEKDTEIKLEIYDTVFYEYFLDLEESQPLYDINDITIDNVLSEIEGVYAFCKGGKDDNFCDESESKNQITFVKDKDGRIGIVKHQEANYRGRVGLSTDESGNAKNSIEIYYNLYPEYEDAASRLIIPGCS